MLEWIAISYSRGSSWPRDQTWVSCIAGRFFTIWATRDFPQSHVILSLQTFHLWSGTMVPRISQVFREAQKWESIRKIPCLMSTVKYRTSVSCSKKKNNTHQVCDPLFVSMLILIGKFSGGNKSHLTWNWERLHLFLPPCWPRPHSHSHQHRSSSVLVSVHVVT